jgi:hypothetical protein
LKFETLMAKTGKNAFKIRIFILFRKSNAEMMVISDFLHCIAYTQSCAGVASSSFNLWHKAMKITGQTRLHTVLSIPFYLSALSPPPHKVRNCRAVTRNAVNFCVNRSRLALSRLRLTSANSLLRVSFNLA